MPPTLIPPSSASKRILCIHLPQWSIARLRRRRPELRHEAVAIIESGGNRRSVVEMSAEAGRHGVRVDLAMVEARAICPDLHCIECNAIADQQALRALARWLTRFTPIVAVGWEEDENRGADAPALRGQRRRLPQRAGPSSARIPAGTDSCSPAVLFLDISGCERFFNGIGPLVKRISAALARFAVPASIAVAPTPGAAWALASNADAISLQCRVGIPAHRSPPGEEAPVGEHAHPTLSNAVGSALRTIALRAGETVRGADPTQSKKDPLPNPLPAYRARGPEGAVGPAVRTVPLRAGKTVRTADPTKIAGPETIPIVDAIELHAALAPLPVSSLRLDGETLAALHHLGLRAIGSLLALPRDQLPARFGPLLLKRLDQAFGVRPEPLAGLAYQVPIAAKMAFESPIDSLETVWIILKELLHRVLADLVRRGHGARQVELVFSPAKITSAIPPPLVKTIRLSRPSRDPANLFNLLRCATENLEAENGFRAIALKIPQHEPISEEQIPLLEGEAFAGQLELDHLVERLCIRLGEGAVLRPALVESHIPERGWAPGEGRAAICPPPALRLRPLDLLPKPLEIRVICEPSDDCEGSPRQFAYRQRVHRIVHAIGPERIAGEWWRGDERSRDYYEVEDAVGQRFWIFRAIGGDPQGPSVRWFLHGRFE